MQPLRKCGGNTIRWRRTFLSRAVFPKHVRHQEQEAASLVGAAQLAAGVRSWVSRRPQGVGAIARRAGYGAAISVTSFLLRRGRRRRGIGAFENGKLLLRDEIIVGQLGQNRRRNGWGTQLVNRS